ncbi:N-6 DNA methylase [Treponema pectinovorum]|uniref:N-6 DNA methylase n=1 Tax=Treponema pectinovorum TaxID=164 RepID=UPI0011CA2787|nr:N-6 DNA methylase [Treponema pectinovorum]
MKIDFYQERIFDKNKTIKISFNETVLSKLKTYSIEDYINDVTINGLEYTWKYICEYVLTYGENENLLNIKNFGELYEIGLAVQDKIKKKNNGQYYTPEDVAMVMSEYFNSVTGENICDVACGTGKLILTFLDFIGEEKSKSLIKDGRLYLYDIDGVALNICKTSILLKYGKDLNDKVNCVVGDFLSTKINLPGNCKVISNPPYAAIQQIGLYWEDTKVLKDSKELYSCFMEKIIRNCDSAVIITPYSFISGAKFFSLRTLMNQCSGEIYSFDNVPGNIFCGRKHGIFNTNTSNSVRAAITVLRKNNCNGFRLTPLIRFKSIERKALLKHNTMETFLSEKRQKISADFPAYYKCFKELQPLYDRIMEKSDNHTLSEIISNDGKYTLSMANTCRYFTSAFSGLIKRNGLIILHFEDEKKFNYAYCLINSSFAYWHWRLFDGGITYPLGLLLKIPVIYNCLTDEDHVFFKQTFNEMSKEADKFIIRKNNVGVQENIKYPREYRYKINQRFFKILNIKVDDSTMNLIHSNMALKVNV